MGWTVRGGAEWIVGAAGGPWLFLRGALWGAYWGVRKMVDSTLDEPATLNKLASRLQPFLIFEFAPNALEATFRTDQGAGRIIESIRRENENTIIAPEWPVLEWNPNVQI